MIDYIMISLELQGSHLLFGSKVKVSFVSRRFSGMQGLVVFCSVVVKREGGNEISQIRPHKTRCPAGRNWLIEKHLGCNWFANLVAS